MEPEKVKTPVMASAASNFLQKARAGLTGALRRIRPVRKRTLFCVIGNLRGGELPFESFLENFGDTCDLCLCVGNTYPDSPWRKQARYSWQLDEGDPKVWENIYDSVSKDWRSHSHVENLWGPYQGLKGSGMIICSFRQILLEKLMKLPVVYDRYVLTRSDHYYVSNHLPEVKPGRIYLPEGEEHGGVTDRFSVANRDTFLQSLRIIPFIIGNPNLFNNVEQYLRAFYRASELRIVKFQRTMYTIGRADEQTRWQSVSEQKAPCGKGEYFLKYPAEYELVQNPRVKP